MRPLFKYLRIIIASVVYQSENKAVLIFFDRLLIANVIKECFDDAVLFQGVASRMKFESGKQTTSKKCVTQGATFDSSNRMKLR